MRIWEMGDEKWEVFERYLTYIIYKTFSFPDVIDKFIKKTIFHILQ